MEIREKIAAELKTKFAGVEDAIINRVADKLARTVKTEQEIAAAVESVTFQTMLQSYGDARASEASLTAVSNYEKKHNLKDGEKVQNQTQGQNPNQPQQQTVQNQGHDRTQQLLEELVRQNKALEDRLNRMDGERTAATRRQKWDEVTKSLPENLRKGYDRITLDTLSDEEFDKLVGEVTTEVEGIAKEYNARGAIFTPPTSPNSPAPTGGKAEQEAELLKLMGLE